MTDDVSAVPARPGRTRTCSRADFAVDGAAHPASAGGRAEPAARRGWTGGPDRPDRRRQHRGGPRASASSPAGARWSPSTRHNETTTASSCHRPRTSRPDVRDRVRERRHRHRRSRVGARHVPRNGAHPQRERPPGLRRDRRRDRGRRDTSEASSTTSSTDLDSSGDRDYSRRPGGEPTGPPGDQTFWVASTSGTGEQTLEWEPEDGDWRAVVMNEDGRAGSPPS